MSEMSVSTNVEAGNTAADSSTVSSAEAGMTGPAEAGDQAGAGSAANDNIPQAANDNAAQAEPASDASTEATGDPAASYAPEVGEVGPPEPVDEVPGSSPREVPEPVNEAAEPVNELPEPVDEVPDEPPQEVPGPAAEAAKSAQVEQPQSPDEVTEPLGPEAPQQEITETPEQGGLDVLQQTDQEVPANDTVPQPDASQTTMSVDPWQRGTLTRRFNDHAGKEPTTGDGQGDREGGTKKTGQIGTPELVPQAPLPRKPNDPHP
jgi:hypothetical protein